MLSDKRQGTSWFGRPIVLEIYIEIFHKPQDLPFAFVFAMKKLSTISHRDLLTTNMHLSSIDVYEAHTILLLSVCSQNITPFHLLTSLARKKTRREQVAYFGAAKMASTARLPSGNIASIAGEKHHVNRPPTRMFKHIVSRFGIQYHIVERLSLPWAVPFFIYPQKNRGFRAWAKLRSIDLNAISMQSTICLHVYEDRS
jgi:hypothetical protein